MNCHSSMLRRCYSLPNIPFMDKCSWNLKSQMYEEFFLQCQYSNSLKTCVWQDHAIENGFCVFFTLLRTTTETNLHTWNNIKEKFSKLMVKKSSSSQTRNMNWTKLTYFYGNHSYLWEKQHKAVITCKQNKL